MAGDQVLTLPDAARCRSSRTPARADDMRARSRPAVGLSEVQERRQTPSGHAAPACTAPAASGGGQVMWSRLLLLVTLVVSAVWSISIGYAFCPERPPCHGCGCKGGPGYRSPDGHCVGFKELDKVCGNPPSRCVFENAPGTGENRECALAPRQSVKKTPD
jgi:hypothetical protein